MNSYYSDIMYTTDPLKFRALSLKHFGSEFLNWDDQDRKKIESFVFDFLGKKIKVHSVKPRVHIGTGIPTWVINYE